MDHKYFGLVEMLFSFGVVLAFAIWEVYSLRRDKKRRDAEKYKSDQQE